jgi:Xaa-Pro dipeptidase
MEPIAMPFLERQKRFQEGLAPVADLAFFPFSADLQYLTGIPRQMPSFGALIHPGEWLEGAWISPEKGPILTLSHMTILFRSLMDLPEDNLHVIKDQTDPHAVLQEVLASFSLPKKPRVALGYRSYEDTVVELQRVLPGVEFKSATELMRPLRVIKSEEEIAALRRGGEITEAAFREVLTKLKHGMTELDVLTEVEYQLIRHGSLGPAYSSLLEPSGPHHPLLFGQPEKSMNRELHPPVSVQFDFGGIIQGYCYDYGRTVAFGEPDKEFRKIYDLVMESQAVGITAIRVGEIAADVDTAARTVIESGGYGEAFRHRLGHSIGLDVHEPPFLTAGDKTILQEGMVFTVEPSINQYDSFSTRVEDLVVVREEGGVPLTTGFQDLYVID